jgi:hypothetical protein
MANAFPFVVVSGLPFATIQSSTGSYQSWQHLHGVVIVRPELPTLGFHINLFVAMLWKVQLFCWS